ncbi:hypothetical protein GIS00_19095 [Nakamurella sp. YIM 132087]|uniref:Uncharacterized protein n=1 Tax=Nakamurella alba TaxID=2665158 RepID=A0A7K1FPH7_9ACTN|nr:hypothetical protein [Nakamurella alba]MTD16047.1 hypothetical protein [Nakamurella alba]
MKVRTTASALLLGSFAVLTLSACNPGIAGTADAVASSVAKVAAGVQVSGGPSATASAISAGGAASTTAPNTTAPNTTKAQPAGGHGSGSGQGTGGGNQDGSGPGDGMGGGAGETSTVTEESGVGEVTTTSESAETDSTETWTSTSESHSTETSTETSSWHHTPAPEIVSAEITCSIPEGATEYSAFLTYEVANADAMALSIDNPGIVGSYGTYDWHGTIEIPANGCYAEYGEQTYTLTTVGGEGEPATLTITRTGEYTKQSTPPFAPGGAEYTQPSTSTSTSSALPTPEGTTESALPTPDGTTTSEVTSTDTTE